MLRSGQPCSRRSTGSATPDLRRCRSVVLPCHRLGPMSALDRWREFRRAQRAALLASNHPHQGAEFETPSGPTGLLADILPGRRSGDDAAAGAGPGVGAGATAAPVTPEAAPGD